VQLGLRDLRLLGPISDRLGHSGLEPLLHEAVEVLARIPRVEHAQASIDFQRCVGQQPVGPVRGEIQRLTSLVVVASPISLKSNCRTTATGFPFRCALRVPDPTRKASVLWNGLAALKCQRFSLRPAIGQAAAMDRAPSQLPARAKRLVPMACTVGSPGREFEADSAR
jgi:hypothetical protein